MITLEQHLAAHWPTVHTHAGLHWSHMYQCKCEWMPPQDDPRPIESIHAAHVAATWREAQDAEAAEYVGERVDRIIATGERDNESAHDAEDKLLRDLVDSYAPPQVKAHVERLGKAPFARWCA